MTFFVRLSTAFVLAATLFSSASVSASAIEARHGWGGGGSGGNHNNNNGGCGNNEFRFRRGKADCCLPKGGIQHPPPPPPEHKCPVRGYYWNNNQGCCVPDNEPDDDDEPECPSGCGWNRHDQFCQPHHPVPSGIWSGPPKGDWPKGGHGGHGGNGGGHGGNGNGHGGNGGGHGGGGWNWDKRDLKSRSEALCPSGLSACPISGLTGGEYECLDVSVELESCGGCASVGEGQDCTAIPGAWNVGCEMGSCAVYTCKAGYSLAADKKSCVPL